MGMFDNIQCNYPLPLPLEVIDIIPDIYEQELQTKCLECLMDLYYIDEEGHLLHEKKTYEWRDDDSYFLKGYMQPVETSIERINHHGYINFYVYERIIDENDKDKGLDVSVDYLAKFTNGKLDTIELKNYSIEDASEHIKRNKDFFDKIEKKRNLWYNKYFFNTKPVSYTRKKIRNALYRLHNLTGRIHSLAIKYL